MEKNQPNESLPLLRRAGRVLFVVGLLDILLMIIAIMNRMSYSSSLNIFAVIAGIFLIRGNLRAASLVRWFAFFIVAALGSGLLAAPFIQPWGLTWARIQSQPGAYAFDCALYIAVMATLIWLAHALGTPEIRAARAQAGRPTRDMRIPAALGVVLVVMMMVVSGVVQRTESAARAVYETKIQMGDEYSYHVSSLNIHSGPNGTVVQGVVTAWKSGVVRDIPFRWRE